MASILEPKLCGQSDSKCRLHVSERERAVLQDSTHDAKRLSEFELYRFNTGTDENAGSSERGFSRAGAQSGLHHAETIPAARWHINPGIYANGGGRVQKKRRLRLFCKQNNTSNRGRRRHTGTCPIPEGVLIVGEIYNSLAVANEVSGRYSRSGRGNGVGSVRNDETCRKRGFRIMAIAASFLLMFSVVRCPQAGCTPLSSLSLKHLASLTFEEANYYEL